MPSYKQQHPAEPLVPETECGHQVDRQEVRPDHVLCLDQKGLGEG